jgi:hypothetical protein
MTDWSNAISALGGASVTFFITVYGRREARADARQARHDAIEDDRRRERDKKASTAVEEILQGIELRFSLRRPAMETEADYEKADELVRIMYHQVIYIPDPEVRALIEEAAKFLDYRARLLQVDIDLREIVYQVRLMLHEVLGSWQRNEKLPELKIRYLKIREEFDKLPRSAARAKEDIRGRRFIRRRPSARLPDRRPR